MEPPRETFNPDKKTLEQCTEADLNQLVYTDHALRSNAVEERSYRSTKRMMETQDKMLELAAKLERQTGSLINLTSAVRTFTIVLIVLTIGLLVEGGVQFLQLHQNSAQPPIQKQQSN